MKSLTILAASVFIALFPSLSNAWEVGKEYRARGVFCKTQEAAESMPRAHKERGLDAAKGTSIDLAEKKICGPGFLTFVLKKHISTYKDLKFGNDRTLTLHVLQITAPDDPTDYFVVVQDGFDK